MGLERRQFIARNHLRLNVLVSTLLLMTQIFPILLPWYADPNYEAIMEPDNNGGFTYQEP